MKTKITMASGKKYRADFGEAETLTDVREWLNCGDNNAQHLKSFMSVGEKVLINVDYIVEVKPCRRSLFSVLKGKK